MKRTSAQPRTSRAKRKVEAQQLLEEARTLAVSRSKPARGKAFELLHRASRIGNAEASYAIGTWHLYGRHVPKNFSAAARFFERAAKQAYAPAAFDLAVMCETGRGVSKNLSRAFDLYLRAANLGDADAIRSVARCIYHGIGTARVPALARLVLNRCS